MTFWIAAVVLTLAAVALLLPPLLGKGRAAGIARDDLNVTLFKDRLTELEKELGDEEITPAQYEQARRELEQDLLFNTGGASTAVRGGGRWMAIIVALLVPVVAFTLYNRIGSPDLIDADPAAAGQPAMGIDIDINQMIERLRQRLAETPDDAEGWVLLGRSLAMMERYREAEQAFAKALEQLGDFPPLLAEYAETKAMVQGGLSGEPMELVRRALAADPNQQRALWLAGIEAYERQAFSEAAGYWERLLPQLEQGSETYQMVEQNIEQARAQAGQ